MSEGGDLGKIERWWRVMPPGGRQSIWTDEDPSDQLTAGWAGATVEGPFVPEADSRGAIARADELADLLSAYGAGSPVVAEALGRLGYPELAKTVDPWLGQ